MEQTDLEAQALRYNSGKIEWDLVDFKSLHPMVRVLMFGAEKYTPDNWKKGMPKAWLLNSAMRHLTAILDGEEIDSESGLPHVGHLMCNTMFISFFEQGLGSEKAMANYKKDDSLKQYPVTVEEAKNIVWFNEVHKELHNNQIQNELLTAPEGYVWIDLEQVAKLYKGFKAITFKLYEYGKCYMSIKNEPMLSNCETLIKQGVRIALLKKDYDYHLS